MFPNQLTLPLPVTSTNLVGRDTLSPETKRELQLFLDYAEDLNGFPLLQDYRQQAIQAFLPQAQSFAGDASVVGVCVYAIQSPSKLFFQDQLSDEEQTLSSGHRELLTLKKSVLSGLIPDSSSVVWYTDSKNLVSFWEKGSPKIDIQFDIIKTLLHCEDKNIELLVLHLPREDPRIEAADVGSRHFDKDDWGIDSASFSVLQFRFLPKSFTLDPFATPSNARLPRFFSCYVFPGSLATDGLSVPWEDECLFVFPPISKLISAWKKITIGQGSYWKSATFWPILFPDGNHASWPATAVESFDPFIVLGQFYSGVMQGRNNYLFCAIFFDTSASFDSLKSSLCYFKNCSH